MGIQKIIDPSDPQSVARLLNRVNAIEKASAANTAKLRRAQLQLTEAAALSYQGQGVNNLAFNYDGATSLTWAAAFINDKQGNQYQIPSGSATVATGTSYNVVFNPEHPTLVVTTTAIADLLKEPNSLLACTLYLTTVNTSFGPGGTGSPANGSVNGLNFGSSSGGSFKSENIQYTPVTKSNTAANQTYMSFAIPANEMAVGQALRVTVTGTLTNTSGGAVQYTPILKLSATTWLTGNTASIAGATTAVGWGFEFLIICTTAGSGGTVEVQMVQGQINGTSGSYVGNTATKAFDTTISNTLNWTATMDTAVATASMTQRQMTVERLG